MAIPEYEVCLSIHRALLGVVTPALRRVSFELDENLIIVYYYYDGEPSEIEEELVGNTEAEIIADFPGDYRIDCRIINVKYPEEINSKGWIIFNRYEPHLEG